MPPNVLPIKVLLVDDHEHVLWGLQKLIEGEWPRMMVAGTARNMAQALAGVRDKKPDVVVLDIQLGKVNALDHMSELISSNGPQVVILTAMDKRDLHGRAIRSGARSIVMKQEPAEILLREIERANESRDVGVAL